MLRTAKFLPSLKKHIDSLKFDYTMPSGSDAAVGAAHGLADLQEYHRLDVDDLVQGRLKDYVNPERFFQAASNLTSQECLLVATEAKRMEYLEGQVLWLKGAVNAAKAEGKPSKYISKLK